MVESHGLMPEHPIDEVLVDHELEGDTEAQEIESCLYLALVKTLTTQV